MCELAKECGFSVPESVSWDSTKPFPKVNYPCIVKPNKNSVSHPKTFKTRKCDNEKSLRTLLSNVPEGNEFIIQDYVAKESELLMYGCRLADGSIVMPGALVKERWSIYGDGSYGTVLKKAPDEFDKSPISTFLERISYHGLFSFEFGLSKGKYYFYEVNLRNDGTSHYFFQAGANVPAAWVLSSNKLPYQKELGIIEKDTPFIDEVFDCFNIKEGVLSKRDWKKQRKEAGAFVYYQTDDPKPYYYMKAKAFAKGLLMKIKKG